MSNFTSEVKNEIISSGIAKKSCRRAALSAFFRVSGELSYDFFTHDYGAEFITESERAAEFFFSVIEDLYEVPLMTTFKPDRMSGREKLRFGFKGDCIGILSDLGVLSEEGDLVLTIRDFLIDTPEKKIAYVKGAFIGSGSCTVPTERRGKTGYHLQFIFRSREIADNFSEILRELELLAKTIEHKGSYVVYINSKEAISDFLSVVGANDSLERFGEIVFRRDSANNENRTLNCASSNRSRTQKASFAQFEAIRFMRNREQFHSLPPSLRELAEARLAHKEYSLQQLADSLNISKSCANHRMKKLMEIYDLLEK